MFLKKLELINFRNYSNLSLEFDNRPTILVGNNAVGKSNLLEAIYFLSTTKSARVEVDSELIKQGEDVSRVQGTVDSGPSPSVILRPKAEESLTDVSRSETSGIRPAPRTEISRSARNDNDDNALEISMQVVDGNLSKRVKVNGIPRRTVDFIGNLPAIIFYPSDINMVTGPPALRRWHLDLALSQVDQDYKKALTLYEQILTNRNKVLKRIKEGEGKVDELTYWSQELIKHGQVISQKRKVFLEFMNNLKTPLGNFQFEYDQNAISQERLDQYSGREIAAAVTLVGPHRDNFRIVILDKPSVIARSETTKQSVKQIVTLPSVARNDASKVRNLAHFGSRGEQRTATLAFKLAQLEYMAERLGQRPILLLDDVFSELDAAHRAHVVEVVSKQQTIMATVELENIPKKFLDSARILKVEDGKIT